MRIGPPWHIEARRMYADGATMKAIAKHFGKSSTSVRTAVDPRYYEAQLKANRQVKIRERERLRGTEIKKVENSLDRMAARAYVDKPALTKPSISLPRISLPDLPVEMEAKPQIRLAPTPHITVNEGAERIRAIHQRMLRRGLIAPRGLVEEFGL